MFALSKHLTVALLFLSIHLGYESHGQAMSCQQSLGSSRSNLEADIADRVLAVHLTNFFPVDGIVRASPKNSGRFGVTLHFSLGQPVIDHAFGKWADRRYGVVTPLRNLEPQLLNLLPQDSFVLGDLRLSKDAVIFAPEGEPIPEVPIRIIRYNPKQKTLKDSIVEFIKESGSMVFAAEGPFSYSKLTIDGKQIDPEEQIRSLFQDIHERNPNLTSTTHDYTLWGFIDNKVIDLLAAWYISGSSKTIEDSDLLIDILGIEMAIPEVIKVARERQIPSEAAKSLNAGLKNIKSYLRFLRLELDFRRDYHKTILGTDLRGNPTFHQQIISAIEKGENVAPLLIDHLDLLSSIATQSIQKNITLDPSLLASATKYANMEQFESLMGEYAPSLQQDNPKLYHSIYVSRAFRLLMNNKISYNEFSKYFTTHFFQLESFPRSVLLSNFLVMSFTAWPKVPQEVALFFRRPDVQSIINEDDYFDFYNKSARELATMNYLFKAILKPKNLKFVKAEGRAGAWYKDDSDRMWYLKRDEKHAELQTAAEVISSMILRRFKYQVPYVQIVYLNGIRYAAIEGLPPGQVSMTLSEVSNKNIKPLRVFAAFLKDWDRVRSYNNFVYPSGNDQYAMFDFGGTLGAKAMGDHKPGSVVSEAIGSFENTRNFADIYYALRFFQG